MRDEHLDGDIHSVRVGVEKDAGDGGSLLQAPPFCDDAVSLVMSSPAFPSYSTGRTREQGVDNIEALPCESELTRARGAPLLSVGIFWRTGVQSEVSRCGREVARRERSIGIPPDCLMGMSDPIPHGC